MRVVFFWGQVGKIVSAESLRTKRQSVANIRNKNDFCGTFSVRAQLHPPGNNPFRVSNCTKNLLEIKTDRNDFINGLKSDDIEKREKLKNLNLNTFSN